MSNLQNSSERFGIKKVGILYLLSMLLVLATKPDFFGEEIEVLIAEWLGASFAIFLFGILLGGWVRGNAGIVIALVPMIIATYYMRGGNTFNAKMAAERVSESAAENFKVRPINCEFEVSFPYEPTEITNRPTNSAQFVSYQYESMSGFFLRSECVPVDAARRTALESELDEMLSSYASANGLANLEIAEFDSPGLGEVNRLRGYKTVGDQNTIYQIHVVIGETSFISIQTGGPASDYPQLEVIQFIDSLKFSTEIAK